MVKLRLSFSCFNELLKVYCGYMRVKLLLKTLLVSIGLLVNLQTQAQAIDTAKDTNKTDDRENSPKTSSIERSVMPVTQWLENKLQNNSLIQPSIYIDDKKSETVEIQLTLREAIEQAKQQQAGTVLSAKKISNESGITFEVKILAESGIIKIIEIEDDKESKNQ